SRRTESPLLRTCCGNRTDSSGGNTDSCISALLTTIFRILENPRGSSTTFRFPGDLLFLHNHFSHFSVRIKLQRCRADFSVPSLSFRILFQRCAEPVIGNHVLIPVRNFADTVMPCSEHTFPFIFLKNHLFKRNRSVKIV